MPADHPNGAGGVFRRLRRLLRDSCATVSIEFAFALPILCGMTFALYEVTEGVIAYMRVVDVANTVSDLIGMQLTAPGGIGKQEFDNYYIAAQMVMSQTNGSNLAVAVASVYYDVNGANPTVAWQIQRGGAGVISNATSFVSNLGTPNGSTIIVQATYTYQSALNYFITSPFVISSEVAGEPRHYLPGAGYLQGIPCPPPNGSEPCS